MQIKKNNKLKKTKMNCTYFNCNEPLNSAEDFVNHLFYHSNDAFFRLKCPFCKTTMDCYEIAKNHIKKFHFAEKELNIIFEENILLPII